MCIEALLRSFGAWTVFEPCSYKHSAPPELTAFGSGCLSGESSYTTSPQDTEKFSETQRTNE
jgi:hypothetical protein